MASLPERPLSCNDYPEHDLNDLFHEVGCGCPDCRPDLHDPREQPLFDAARRDPEAA